MGGYQCFSLAPTVVHCQLWVASRAYSCTLPVMGGFSCLQLYIASYGWLLVPTVVRCQLWVASRAYSCTLPVMGGFSCLQVIVFWCLHLYMASSQCLLVPTLMASGQCLLVPTLIHGQRSVSSDAHSCTWLVVSVF